MAKVRLVITESNCRCGYFKKGQEFLVEDLCPPLCHELWNAVYPSVYALLPTQTNTRSASAVSGFSAVYSQTSPPCSRCRTARSGRSRAAPPETGSSAASPARLLFFQCPWHIVCHALCGRPRKRSGHTVCPTPRILLGPHPDSAFRRLR